MLVSMEGPPDTDTIVTVVVVEMGGASEGSSLTRRKGLALPTTARGSFGSDDHQPHACPPTPSRLPHPLRSRYKPSHTQSLHHGLISGPVLPASPLGRGSRRRRAAGALQRRPRALSQVCTSSRGPGRFHTGNQFRDTHVLILTPRDSRHHGCAQ